MPLGSDRYFSLFDSQSDTSRVARPGSPVDSPLVFAVGRFSDRVTTGEMQRTCESAPMLIWWAYTLVICSAQGVLPAMWHALSAIVSSCPIEEAGLRRSRDDLHYQPRIQVYGLLILIPRDVVLCRANFGSDSMKNSPIEWTHHTFNPWIGCTQVSPACDNCYAMTMMDHRYHRVEWGAGKPRREQAANTGASRCVGIGTRWRPAYGNVSFAHRSRTCLTANCRTRLMPGVPNFGNSLTTHRSSTGYCSPSARQHPPHGAVEE